MDDKANELQQRMQTLLAAQTPDFGEILRVANELARLDPTQARFSVDAGIIPRLGAELVGKQETALAELVKNAYDADAPSVDVVFENASDVGGRLTIEDSGHGMSRDQLVNGFMRISTPDKMLNPRSPRFKRQRAGRKGVGRFAAQRLGRRLTLITQTIESDLAIRMEIDWDAFIPQSDLAGIASKVTTNPKTRDQGTTLIISDLADAWSDAKIERAYRYVYDLLQPAHAMFEQVTHPTISEASINSVESDPGFVASFLWEGRDGKLNIADENTMLLNHRLATISAWVNEAGKSVLHVDAPRIGIDTPAIVGERVFKHLKGVRLTAYYFIVEGGNVPTLLLGGLQKMLNRSGGVRLYRNGFRVRPYGEQSDDWLGLDESASRRSILVPHRNRNFVGFVSVNDVIGKQFNETLSREGLIEGDAFEELREFAFQALADAVLRIGAARGKKVRTNDPPRASPSDRLLALARKLSGESAGESDSGNDLPISPRTPTLDAPQSVTGSSDSTLGNDRPLEMPMNAQAVVEEIRAIASAQEAERTDLLKELGMLRVLASLGLVIGQFTHEVRHDLVALAADVGNLRRLSLSDAAGRIVGRMTENLESLSTFAAYFDRSISDNLMREMRPLDLREVIGKFRNAVAKRASAKGISVSIDVRGANLVARPMHPSEWNSVLFNFFSNAEKAIRRTGVQGKILIRAGKIGSEVYLDFSDNGDGVPVEDRERIFEYFYTTAHASAIHHSDTEALQGTGLGLAIVRDIALGAHGSVAVIDAPDGYSTCIRISVPAAAERTNT